MFRISIYKWKLWKKWHIGHIDNKGKDIVILGEGPTQGLDDTTSAVEAKNFINFTQSGKRLVLSIHYNESIIFWKILQLIIRRKNRIKRNCEIFSADFNPIDAYDISDIHIYLMKGKQYKTMFGLIKKAFIGLLTGMVSASNHTKCALHHKCMIQPSLINLHPNQCSQEFHYYPFSAKLDSWVGSCNTLNNLYNKVCVPNKTKKLNLSVFKIILGI